MARMELAQSECRFRNRRRRKPNEIKEANLHRNASEKVLILSFPLRNFTRYLYCVLRILERRNFKFKRAS